MKKQVLMLYPSSSPNNPESDVEFQKDKNVPIGILSIGAVLEKEDFKVKIIDGRLYSKKKVIKLINSELEKSFCIGVSVTTPQIKHALQICDFIKKKNKKISIVWGGIHPSLYPTQTIEDKSVDYVIRGEAEFTFVNLVKYLTKRNQKLEEIKGLCYKKNGKVTFNGISPPIDPNILPPPAYHLLEIEYYINREFRTYVGTIKKMMALDIPTSRGCPYRCTFCVNVLPVYKKWRPIKIKQVLSQIDYLVKKYNLNYIVFVDDFFFGRKDRVEEIAKHLIKKKYNLMWDANARADLFNPQQINDKLLRLIKRSGCFVLKMGIESGSERILKLIKKDITIEQSIHAVKQCEKHGIITAGGFMCGFPSETKEEIIETAKLILKLRKISPKSLLWAPTILRPYPGTEIYQECIKKGFKSPKTLREWASKKLDVGSYIPIKDISWIKNPRWLLKFKIFFYILLVSKSHELTKRKISFVWKILAKIAEFRFNHDFWFFAIEPPLLINFKNFLDSSSISAKLTKKILKFFGVEEFP